jgi:hypothetical protein
MVCLVPIMVLLVLIVAIIAVITAHVDPLVFRGQHKVNRPTASVVLAAIPAPVPHMTRRNV